MSYTEAMALIRQAERQQPSGSGGTTVLLPSTGILPVIAPRLPAPRRTGG